MEKRTIFFFGWIAFLFFLNYISNNPKYIVEHVKSGFTGVIVDKYYLKLNHIKIRKEDGSCVDLASMSPVLDSLSSIGDSIIKIKNENYCVLYHKNRRITMSYVSISTSDRNYPTWPKEWKDKWPESTYDN